MRFSRLSAINFLLLIIFLLLVLLAGLLRFHKLGAWSWGFDEHFTMLEVKILFGETTVPNEYLHDGTVKNGTVKPEDTQYYRLPRLLCAAYAVHRLGYGIFGEDEFGSRALMAMLGSLSVGFIFLLAKPSIGFAGAFILSLLVLLLPEHILHSQCNRFYIQAFLLISAVILLGAYVAVRQSPTAAFWLGPLSVFMVLSHSLSGIIWAGLLVAIPVNFFCSKKIGEPLFSIKTVKVLRRLMLWSIVLLIILVFHIVPLAADWNQSSTHGYPLLHAAMSFVKMIGWTLFLFSILGIGFTLVHLRTACNTYWLILTLVSGVSVLVLPLKIIYIPFYGFLFTFPFLIMAALFVREVYQRIRESAIPFGSLIAGVWVLFAVLINFPTLLSYYQDGNRPDIRSAFQYVAEHWEDGDRLTGYSMDAAQYYIPDKMPRIPLRMDKTAEKLQEILDTETGGKGGLWIVLQSSRGGLDQNLRQWLSRNAFFEISFTKKRFDYDENNVEVFRVPQKTSRK